MIDKKNIKDSGLLEQYILGELAAQEQNAVEALLNEDFELRSYVNGLEEELEMMAFENAVTPPKDVKNNLLKTIDAEKTNNINFYTYAASVAAVVFFVSSIWLFNQYQEVQRNYDVTNDTLDNLKEEIEQIKSDANTSERLARIIKDENTAPFVVKGNEKVDFKTVVAYVNHEKKEVVINPKQLPKLSSDKTYQMWGDVNGEMIDMGILDPEKDYLAMNYIDNATSINITIEPAGGNDHATVENLVANVFL